MGYESNFEVPDIEDNLLRGVADLTDLLVCPDSEPEGGERGTSSSSRGGGVLFERDQSPP